MYVVPRFFTNLVNLWSLQTNLIVRDRMTQSLTMNVLQVPTVNKEKLDDNTPTHVEQVEVTILCISCKKLLWRLDSVLISVKYRH